MLIPFPRLHFLPIAIGITSMRFHNIISCLYHGLKGLMDFTDWIIKQVF